MPPEHSKLSDQARLVTKHVLKVVGIGAVFSTLLHSRRVGSCPLRSLKAKQVPMLKTQKAVNRVRKRVFKIFIALFDLWVPVQLTKNLTANPVRTLVFKHLSYSLDVSIPILDAEKS